MVVVSERSTVSNQLLGELDFLAGLGVHLAQPPNAVVIPRQAQRMLKAESVRRRTSDVSRSMRHTVSAGGDSAPPLASADRDSASLQRLSKQIDDGP